MDKGSVQPIIHIPWYRTRWFKWSAFGAVLLAVIAIVAIAIFFALWWNGPEKALLDAANYSLEHDGKYHVTSKQSDLTVLVGDDKYEIDGTYDGLQLNAVLSGRTLYVKSPDPAKLYQLLMATDASQIPTAVQTIADSVRNKWIAINLDTVTLQAASAQHLQCFVEEKDSIASDTNARSQWRSAYLAHRFLSVKTTQKTTATTYDVSVDTKARQDFFAALLKTSFYQELTNCSQKTDILSSIEAVSPLASVTLTSKHVFESAIFDPQSASPTKITASYSNVPQIALPASSTSLDQLEFGLLSTFTGL